MDKQTRINTIATHLWAQRLTVKPVSDSLPTDYITDIDTALAIQMAMIKLNNHKVTGWKCLTPRDNGDLIIAPILSDAVLNQPDCSITSSAHNALIEPEIAFIVGETFAANHTYSDSEINQHIGTTHMALELIQQRFSKGYEATFLEKLADGLSNQGLYIGPEIDKSEALAATNIQITVTQNENSQTYDGAHPCHLPASPLYWLVNFLTARGVEITSGQAIITGSYCGVLKVDMNTKIEILYEGLGQMSLHFNEQIKM